jgi:DNA-directed RNA polymerase specialized sigma24 family protein
MQYLVEMIAMFSNSSELGKRVKKMLESPPSEAFEAKTRTLRRVQRKLTDEQLRKLFVGYEQGRPIDELAAHFGIHRSTVLDHLNRSTAKRRYPALDERRIKLAIERYGAGLSLREVGITLDVHASTVRQALIKSGVSLRDPHGRTPEHRP